VKLLAKQLQEAVLDIREFYRLFAGLLLATCPSASRRPCDRPTDRPTDRPAGRPSRHWLVFLVGLCVAAHVEMVPTLQVATACFSGSSQHL